VLACDVVPEKLALAGAFGARPVLNAEASVVEQVRDLTGGGPDVCLECSGHPGAVADGLAALTEGGRMVLVGTGAGEVILSAEQREQLCRRMLTIRGQWMSYRAPWPGLPWTLPLAYLERGAIHPERIITHRYPLADGPVAIHSMLAPGADYIKVLLTH
jgi:L-iditol 2-dehydrogenase